MTAAAEEDRPLLIPIGLLLSRYLCIMGSGLLNSLAPARQKTGSTHVVQFSQAVHAMYNSIGSEGINRRQMLPAALYLLVPTDISCSSAMQLIAYSLQDAVVLSSKRCSDQLAIRLNIDILQMPHKSRMLSHMQHPETAISPDGTEGSRLAKGSRRSIQCSVYWYT